MNTASKPSAKERRSTTTFFEGFHDPDNRKFEPITRVKSSIGKNLSIDPRNTDIARAHCMGNPKQPQRENGQPIVRPLIAKFLRHQDGELVRPCLCNFSINYPLLGLCQLT